MKWTVNSFGTIKVRSISTRCAKSVPEQIKSGRFARGTSIQADEAQPSPCGHSSFGLRFACLPLANRPKHPFGSTAPSLRLVGVPPRPSGYPDHRKRSYEHLDAPSLPPLRALLGQGCTLRPSGYPTAHPFGLTLRHKVFAAVASLQANSKGSAIELRPGSGCAEIRTV